MTAQNFDRRLANGAGHAGIALAALDPANDSASAASPGLRLGQDQPKAP